jgi:hypothetical protein
VAKFKELHNQMNEVYSYINNYDLNEYKLICINAFGFPHASLNCSSKL